MQSFEIKKKPGDPADFNIYFLSESAITLSYNSDISNYTFNQISNLNETIYRNPFEGFQCTVPAYTSLTLFYDPTKVIKSKNLIGINCFERISNYLLQLNKNISDHKAINKQPITIPICYEDEYAPDIKELANLLRIEIKDLIELHAGIQYKVHMIGFVPGFAYLGGMPEILSAPRKNTPRTKIPVGSVGIAGKQTGIYPLETPGGWYLIGRTPIKLFDSKRSPPSLLQAGDEVIFKPINKQDFQIIKLRENATEHY